MSAKHELVEILLALLEGGSVWILWLLLLLGAWIVAILVERTLYLRQVGNELRRLAAELEPERILDADTDWRPAESTIFPLPARLWKEAVPSEIAEAWIADATGELRARLTRGAQVLGTLGANTPFIGLLGTVLGIVEAFRELAASGSGGAAPTVMAGIAEALVATALGLGVAIPAVVGYNWLLRRSEALVAPLVERARLLAARRRWLEDR